MKFIAYVKCLIFQVCKLIKWFQHWVFMKRQLKEKLNSIKTSEVCLLHAVSRISTDSIFSLLVTQVEATVLLHMWREETALGRPHSEHWGTAFAFPKGLCQPS